MGGCVLDFFLARSSPRHLGGFKLNVGPGCGSIYNRQIWEWHHSPNLSKKVNTCTTQNVTLCVLWFFTLHSTNLIHLSILLVCEESVSALAPHLHSSEYAPQFQSQFLCNLAEWVNEAFLGEHKCSIYLLSLFASTSVHYQPCTLLKATDTTRAT